MLSLLTYRYDASFGFIVWLFSGRTNTDEDYQRYVDSIDELSKLEPAVSTPGAIVVVDEENPVPNAHWRRKIAEVTSRVRSDAKVAFVLPSALSRGVVTAVNWVKPLPFEFKTVATFDEAVAWIDAKRGYPSKLPYDLLREARADATR